MVESLYFSFPPLKAQSSMVESLDFSLSWGSFVYNVKKSFLAIDLARFLFMLFSDWIMGSEFCKNQNLFSFDKNLAFFWKFLDWDYTSSKTLEAELEICFIDYILDAMIKRD